MQTFHFSFKMEITFSQIFLFAIVCLMILLIYIYFGEHQVGLDKDWIEAFKFSDSEIDLSDITHDVDVWYYKGRNTCVGYGKINEKCDHINYVCSDGKIPDATHGDRILQAAYVIDAIRSGGKHKKCPIIYQKTSW